MCSCAGSIRAFRILSGVAADWFSQLSPVQMILIKQLKINRKVPIIQVAKEQLKNQLSIQEIQYEPMLSRLSDKQDTTTPNITYRQALKPDLQRMHVYDDK